MENLTEANIRHIKTYWKLRNIEDRKWENYYFSGCEEPNHNYCLYLDDEYRKYLKRLNLDMDDRTYDEELWAFIHGEPYSKPIETYLSITSYSKPVFK